MGIPPAELQRRYAQLPTVGKLAPTQPEFQYGLPLLHKLDSGSIPLITGLTFADIQDVLHTEAQVDLPETLRVLLNIDEHRWTFVADPKGNVYEILFLGHTPDIDVSKLHGSEVLNSATATIRTKRGVSGRDHRVFVSDVQAAGVTHASNNSPRIIGAAYK